jgi:cytochrome P450
MAIHQNPNDYDDPSDYNPDRYYKNEHGLKARKTPDPARRSVYTFGAGRQVYLGMHLGENSLVRVSHNLECCSETAANLL